MPDINLLVTIDAPRKRVYEAISSPAGVKNWWTVDAKEANDELVLGFEQGGVRFRMKPTAAQPPAHLEWECLGDQAEWAGTHLTWDLREAGPAETLLRFTHANWKTPSDYMAQCGYTWVKVLDRLTAYAQSGDPYPYFTE